LDQEARPLVAVPSNAALKASMAHGWCLFFGVPNMGVSKNRGTPKWMVKVMENPIL